MEKISSFDRLRGSISLPLGPLLGALAYVFAPPDLNPEARTLAAVVLGTIVWWLGEPVPLPVTALLSAGLCATLGVAPTKTVFAAFAHPILFLFLGSFVLAKAMSEHKLDERIALRVFAFSALQRDPKRLLAAMAVVSAGLSMWLSNTATTAMLLPISFGLLGAAEKAALQAGRPVKLLNSSFAAGFLLTLAYASTIGGLATPIGTPPNLIGMSLLEKQGYSIDFLGWMRWGLPLSLILLVLLVAVMIRLHPAPVSRFDGIGRYVKEARKRLGPIQSAQRNVLIAFGLTVLGWILPSLLRLALGAESPIVAALKARLHVGTVALFGAGLLFLLPAKGKPTMTWRKAVEIDWGTILLFGGGLSLGGLMFSTGLARFFGEAFASWTSGASAWILIAFAAGAASLISETASNTASANMLVPIVIGLAQGAGGEILGPALAATFGASLGFCLPVSTPPNAIVYGSGKVTIPNMIRAGILLDIAGFIVLVAFLLVLL